MHTGETHDHHMEGFDQHGEDRHPAQETDNHHHMGSHQTFSWQTNAPFLLESLRISSVEGIAIAMIGVLAVSVLFESLSFILHLREHHRDESMRHMKSKDTYHKYCYQVVSALCRMISAGFAYLIMLCVMSMNIWILVSVILGAGLAHFFLRPVFSKLFEQSTEEEVNENRLIQTKSEQDYDGESVRADTTLLHARDSENEILRNEHDL